MYPAHGMKSCNVLRRILHTYWYKSGGRSVGRVRSRTKGNGVFFLYSYKNHWAVKGGWTASSVSFPIKTSDKFSPLHYSTFRDPSMEIYN
jgi:hypothetical protein